MIRKNIELNSQSLSSSDPRIELPAYDRRKVTAGIVHVGIGGFHRSHQACYTDKLLEDNNNMNWGICSVALLSHDKKIFDTLTGQDGLYTLLVKNYDGSVCAKVIGSIVEYLYAPDNSQAVIEKIANPDIKIITLTITEGGYNFDNSTGEFRFGDPLIQFDLLNSGRPKTIFGYLTQALKKRKANSAGGITIQSCDNIQHNGDVTRKMLLAFVAEAEPSLVEWIDSNVSFPNSMVDRITPVTSAHETELLRNEYGLIDAWPVTCEPFKQWVIEDNFINGRPAWENAGAQFVADVSPYEKMKIRILNGGHSLAGFLGILSGYTFVDEAMADPAIESALRCYISREVLQTLDEVPGIDLSAYTDSIISRFKNPFIKDRLTRIISESSSKIPKFILPVISDQLNINGSIQFGTLVIAAWRTYLETAQNIEDSFLTAGSVTAAPRQFIADRTLFAELTVSETFTGIYNDLFEDIRLRGIANVIHSLTEDQA